MKGVIDLKHNLYLYNLYKNGELVGTYTSKEITDICGCLHVGEYIKNNWIYKGIYRFVKINNDGKEEDNKENKKKEDEAKWEFVERFKKEWNTYRFMVLRGIGVMK